MKMEKSRCSKATNIQFELMIDFMSQHKNLFTGKLDNKYTAKDRQKEWKRLAELLNSDGSGPSKSVEKWRKTWNDWKSLTKAKALRIKNHKKKTGGGPVTWENLTPTEEKLIALSGISWINGMEEIEESISEPIMHENDSSFIENIGDRNDITSCSYVALYEDSAQLHEDSAPLHEDSAPLQEDSAPLHEILKNITNFEDMNAHQRKGKRRNTPEFPTEDILRNFIAVQTQISKTLDKIADGLQSIAEAAKEKNELKKKELEIKLLQIKNNEKLVHQLNKQ